ncbi:hypothetical protein TWF281_004907 [Arthrobotrys megalospora]
MMQSKLHWFFLLVALIVGYLSVDVYAQQPNALIDVKSNLPGASNPLSPRVDDPVDFWVFNIRKGRGSDKELDDIREFIHDTVGNDIEQTEEKWARGYKGGVITAEYIVKQWETSVQGFASVESEKNQTGPEEMGLELEPSQGTASEKRELGQKHRISKRAVELLNSQRWENCIVSNHPEVKDLPKTPCPYITDASQGRGVIVYVIDFGFNIRHKDFKNTKWAKDDEHIFVDPKESFKKLRDIKLTEGPNYTGRYHGTSMLSKLLGAKNGIAKSVTPVIVKFTDRKGGWDLRFYVEVLCEILRKVDKKTEESTQAGDFQQFLILASFVVHIPVDKRDVVFDQFIEAFKEVSSRQNVVYVATSGNGTPAGTVRENFVPVEEQYKVGDQVRELIAEADDPIAEAAFPATLGRGTDYYGLVVVGGCDEQGKVVFQTAPWVRVHAPAMDIETAVGKRTLMTGSDYEVVSGTSVAAPAVAGVLATFISTYGDTSRDAKDRLYQLAYPRADIQALPREERARYPSVLYNGFGQGLGEDSDCEVEQRRLMRRADGVNATSGNANSCKPSHPTSTPQQGPPEKEYTYMYDPTLCELCKKANGKTPIDGIIWILEDCPCK